MQHDPAAHIDTHMGDPRRIVGANEKYKVAGFRVGGRYRGGNVIEALGSQPSGIAKAAVGQHPGNKPGTVERGIGIAAAPDIGIANILFRLRDQGCKGFILQC